MEKFLTVIGSAMPVIGFLAWIVVKLFNHSGRIDNLESQQKEMNETKIPSTLADHEARILNLEDENRTVNEKLDKLLSGMAEVKGILQSKKDKE